LTKKVNIEAIPEVKNETFTLKKKQKLLITATVAFAIVLMLAFPYTYASPETSITAETQSSQTRILRAKGIAVEKANSQLVIAPAGFALSLEATEVNATIIKFKVVGGAVKVNGTEYVITGGNGVVIRDKHGFLLQAQGNSLDGQSATLKLAGRYFWMRGRLHVARLLCSLQTENAKALLVMRSVIRV